MKRSCLALAACAGLTVPVQAGDYWTDNSCVRAVPTADLAAEQLKDHAFTLDPVKGTARETATVQGTAITILQSGCESLGWTVSAVVTGDETDLYRRAFALLDLLPLAETSNLPRYDGLSAIQRYRELVAEPRPGEELIAVGGTISTTVSVREETENGASRVVITIGYGPL